MKFFLRKNGFSPIKSSLLCLCHKNIIIIWRSIDDVTESQIDGSAPYLIRSIAQSYLSYLQVKWSAVYPNYKLL